ncbi:sugar kinase [Bacillus sp. 03113]|uniref:sugar kinase n=1 Tax=Bacillus sp. 03113 TaxID=2578211 RepID=UPI0011416FC6|nr:sugar kinase [Bacillus sp. 03113]
MQKLKVITFGEAMAMFMAAEPGPLSKISSYIRELAGAETNVAIGLARLGIEVGWVSKVGNDSFGEFIIDRLKNEHVNIENVMIEKGFATGFQIKSKAKYGDPEVEYYRKGSAASQLSIDDFDERYFLQADHLHVTGIPLAISQKTKSFAQHAVHFMKKHGKSISFDPNLRSNLWASIDEMVKVTNDLAIEADYVMPGLNEGERLTGCKNPSDIASFYLDKGVKLVVIKLGEEGAYYKTSEQEGIVNAFKAKQVIDTVGAGDGFAVGFISGMLEDCPIQEAVERGNVIGSLAVQSQGDHEGYPTRLQLSEYMKKSIQGVK